VPTLRPVLTEYDLGPAGWTTLYRLAHERRRKPADQAQQLILFALDRAMAGEDVELSQERRQAGKQSGLLPADELEGVA
jgi:hypothetical protein